MSLKTAGEFEIDLFAAMYKLFTDGLDTLGLNRAQGVLHSAALAVNDEQDVNERSVLLCAFRQGRLERTTLL